MGVWGPGCYRRLCSAVGPLREVMLCNCPDLYGLRRPTSTTFGKMSHHVQPLTSGWSVKQTIKRHSGLFTELLPCANRDFFWSASEWGRGRGLFFPQKCVSLIQCFTNEVFIQISCSQRKESKEEHLLMTGPPAGLKKVCFQSRLHKNGSSHNVPQLHLIGHYQSA